MKKKLLYDGIPEDRLTVGGKRSAVMVFETPKFYEIDHISLYQDEGFRKKIKKSECEPFPSNPDEKINDFGTTILEVWLQRNL